MKLRIVGDIHGKPMVINQLAQSLHKFDLTVQLGDYGLGFPRYKQEKLPEEFFLDMNPELIKVILGNHDNFESAKIYPHVLKRFGTFEFSDKLFFYVSGAFSTDQDQRTQGIDWWEYEELSYIESLECLDLWDQVKDKIYCVLSHDCPMVVAHALGLGQDSAKTSTRELLQQIYEIHEPSLWFFGHHHKSKTIKHTTTEFRCLNINEEIVLDL